MRKWRICICVLLIMALIPALIAARNTLPVKERDYIKKKYAGWNGVLRAWFCCEWECAYGFTGWLNRCAAAFEKENPGVYIEIEPVTAETAQKMNESGLNLPDLMIFSSGLLKSGEGLIPPESPVPLRSALSAAGCGYALPVAMGGYILAKKQSEDMPSVSMPADGRFSWSAALIALSEAEPAGIDVPESGIDLGLTASAGLRSFQLNRSDSALNDFINGGAPAAVIDQKGLAKLIALRDAGRGPEWSLVESGRYAYTDQLLLCGVVQTGRADAASRRDFSVRFAQSLLSEENQAGLTSTGAFSVLTERIYPDASSYAPLERLLVSRTLIVPPCFHARQDFSALADRLAAGTVSPEEAGRMLAAAYGENVPDAAQNG